jgi:hypothetical protein
MNKNYDVCNDYCLDLKTICQYEKITTENRFLNLIVEKNNIIIKQDKIITDLYDIVKLYVSEIELNIIQSKLKSRFDV